MDLYPVLLYTCIALQNGGTVALPSTTPMPKPRIPRQLYSKTAELIDLVNKFYVDDKPKNTGDIRLNEPQTNDKTGHSYGRDIDNDYYDFKYSKKEVDLETVMKLLQKNYDAYKKFEPSYNGDTIRVHVIHNPEVLERYRQRIRSADFDRSSSSSESSEKDTVGSKAKDVLHRRNLVNFRLSSDISAEEIKEEPEIDVVTQGLIETDKEEVPRLKVSPEYDEVKNMEILINSEELKIKNLDKEIEIEQTETQTEPVAPENDVWDMITKNYKWGDGENTEKSEEDKNWENAKRRESAKSWEMKKDSDWNKKDKTHEKKDNWNKQSEDWNKKGNSWEKKDDWNKKSEDWNKKENSWEKKDDWNKKSDQNKKKNNWEKKDDWNKKSDQNKKKNIWEDKDDRYQKTDDWNKKSGNKKSDSWDKKSDTWDKKGVNWEKEDDWNKKKTNFDKKNNDWDKKDNDWNKEIEWNTKEKKTTDNWNKKDDWDDKWNKKRDDRKNKDNDWDKPIKDWENDWNKKEKKTNQWDSNNDKWDINNDAVKEKRDDKFDLKSNKRTPKDNNNRGKNKWDDDSNGKKDDRSSERDKKYIDTPVERTTRARQVNKKSNEWDRYVPKTNDRNNNYRPKRIKRVDSYERNSAPMAAAAVHSFGRTPIPFAGKKRIYDK